MTEKKKEKQKNWWWEKSPCMKEKKSTKNLPHVQIIESSIAIAGRL